MLTPLITTIRGTPKTATMAPLKAVPTRLISDDILEKMDCPRTMSSRGMISSISVLVAGE